jgi:hypothetical protein
MVDTNYSCQFILILIIHTKMINKRGQSNKTWPNRPDNFPELMTPAEAAMFLRLDETGHTPDSATRTLNYWRNQGFLKATKYARRVWYLKEELKNFLKNKTAQ